MVEVLEVIPEPTRPNEAFESLSTYFLPGPGRTRYKLQMAPLTIQTSHPPHDG
jgi:hypothetical protein